MLNDKPLLDPMGNVVKSKTVKFGKNKGKTKETTIFSKENRNSPGHTAGRKTSEYYLKGGSVRKDSLLCTMSGIKK
jgi:hypothetical protein